MNQRRRLRKVSYTHEAYCEGGNQTTSTPGSDGHTRVETRKPILPPPAPDEPPPDDDSAESGHQDS